MLRVVAWGLGWRDGLRVGEMAAGVGSGRSRARGGCFEFASVVAGSGMLRWRWEHGDELGRIVMSLDSPSSLSSLSDGARSASRRARLGCVPW